jgi:hypothetical protein
MFFRRRHKGTIIEEGLKITGSVSAEGLVEINGRIEGDVQCTSLIISPKAAISGGTDAERILVKGRVEGPVRGGPGAYFEGRSVCSLETHVQKAPEKLTARLRKEMELKATREPVEA